MSDDYRAGQIELGAAERGFVYAIGRRWVREPDAAEEIAQEAMLVALRKRHAFRGVCHPHTWLYRIAKTAAFDYLRRQRRRVAREAAAGEHEQLTRAAAPSVDVVLSRVQSAAALDAEIAKIDEKYAAVLRLRADDLRDGEIAKRLGLSLSAVKVRAHRARGVLRAALATANA